MEFYLLFEPLQRLLQYVGLYNFLDIEPCTVFQFIVLYLNVDRMLRRAYCLILDSYKLFFLNFISIYLWYCLI